MNGPGGEPTRTEIKLPPPSRPRLGLRSQLLIGLAVVSLFAVVSMGALALWAASSHLRQARESTVNQVAVAAAATVAAVVDGERALADAGNVRAVQPLIDQLSERSAGFEISIIDLERKVVLARPGRAPGDEDPPIVLAALSGVPGVMQYRPRFVDGETELLCYAPIVRGKARVLGVVRVAMAAPAPIPAFLRSAGPVLLGLALADALLLVGLGYLLLTRMVVTPLRAVEQATAKVSAGELELEVKPDGPREIAALATAFNQMTLSLASQRDQLIRSEKLASVGQLAAGVAHEIGNPLAAILGYADLLKSDAEGPADALLSADERRDITTRVKAETQRIHRIIKDLLEYSRPGRQEAQSTCPVEVLLAARDLLAPQARFRDVRVRLAGDARAGDWPRVLASPGRLTQVFVNLLFNAADAMDGKGVIEVTCMRDDDGVHIVVADEGPGVPRELRRKIFDPFFTTKEVGKGTGLGLAICRAIVDSHGGKLDLLATPAGETGARFAVTLKPA